MKSSGASSGSQRSAALPTIGTLCHGGYNRFRKPDGHFSSDVSVRELKNGLSEYLRRVRSGEEIHVTLRGRRIARLLPEPVIAPENISEGIARLDAAPWIDAPKRSGKPIGVARALSAETSSEDLVRWLRD